ncbi:LOW QUALITY PROTEIN: extracellular superoxide dismutase [Cu-Zn]-like [Brachionichthys hirsutus]|uniref:LOW QUALITY PROTEIN: extracellular superoxide dismutase [Cu-Zn]-like n=1 Tax=Brachionichthys hirsutus TaxID=412623 RepID=UPI003604838E
MRLYGSMSQLGAVLIVLAGCLQCASAHSDIEAPPEVLENSGVQYAACKLRPSSTLAEGLPKVYGQVLFKQDYPNGKLKVFLQISGFPIVHISKLRPVHIHQHGDLSQGCSSTGSHFNPHGVPHPHHPGDFGNFETQRGEINAKVQANATLFGGLSIIGRALVIHEKQDDMGQVGDIGSLLNGNAGQRLGCCVIGISSPSIWNMSHN